ncbi:hypothetical protein [Kineobactrum salinum]|uniref:Uncharacterized protein n=1 Tax=Kineobactrum salinum TaxID=2708301 RepID=A0A6C0U4B1_9GAMM|nr:hypothetical protein [Kineobactrum salinum]QIB66768.1 hypothetical protein G3T16_16570 [Kineobactrum salinum]
MEPRYNIYFDGQLLDGHTSAEVRARLARLFKADEATLDKLFSGKLQLLKRDCDKATALHYKQALERAGARPLVRQSAVDSPPPAAGTTDAITLAPAGTEVLRPGERSQTPAPQVQAPDFELASAGTRLAATGATPPAAPDVSHLGLAALGEPLAAARQPVPEAVNIDPEILLAAPDSDFSDCARAEAPEPALDLSGLELAPSGADVLEEKYRRRPAVAVPDTGKLRLEP